MIYIERTIEISNNEAKIYNNEIQAYSNKEKIEEPVVLYKGDRNIEIQFTIKNNPFKYKSGIDITYGQLVIKRPKASPIFSDMEKLSNGKVLFIITDEMIDELDELGDYDFQIKLLNDDKTSRGTLPPVYAGIVIKEPICEEEGVNFAVANYVRTMKEETINTFDDEGNYIKTVWDKGSLITDTKLNKIEDAIYEINANSATKEDIGNIDAILDNINGEEF